MMIQENMRNLIIIFGFLTLSSCNAAIEVGAAQKDLYLPELQGKRVGLLVNHTSIVGDVHLVDFLQSQRIVIQKIFTPEHGFRGQADAGACVHDDVDEWTGIPLVSLHGHKLKPRPEDLADIDILVFDLQDVGVRFYTYVSTLQYFMEAAAQSNKPLIILDRPNPNGFYIDGPVLEPGCKTFVGMQPVPIVYGMTVGEYALMLNGEGWLENGMRCEVKVVPCRHYSHRDLYRLPIPPSPNLKTMTAVYLYPSICLFEGTPISVGRGTIRPFEMFGHPELPDHLSAFIPQSCPGSQEPLFKETICYGFCLAGSESHALAMLHKKIKLSWLIDVYEFFPRKQEFFSDFTGVTPFRVSFKDLAGTKQLAEQLAAGWTEEQIRASWQPGIDLFKKKRKRYLLYPDFE